MSLAPRSSCRSGAVWDRDLSSRCDEVRLAHPAQVTITDILASPRSKERVTLVLSVLGLAVWHWNSVPMKQQDVPGSGPALGLQVPRR